MNKIEEKFNKFKQWAMKPYNFMFIALFAALIAYRLYWFFKVGNQALWWDEGEYMNMANALIGNYSWEIDPIRPLLIPFLMAFIFKIGLGETTIRVIMLMFSVAAIVLTYKIGELFFDKYTGLIGAALLSVFWSFTFYSYRILVDIPVTFFWLATIYVFFDAYLNNKSAWRYAIAGILMGMAFLTKFSSIALVVMIAVYLLITEREKVFFSKKIILFYLASLATVIPFFIWNYIKYGSALAFFSNATESSSRSLAKPFFESLVNQTIFSVQLIHLVPIVLFIVGIVLFIGQVIILYDRTIKKDTKPNKMLFIILWIGISLLFFGYFSYVEYMDERYYFVFYPAIFLTAASAIIFAYNHIKKYSRVIGIFLILVLLGFAAYPNVQQAKSIIEVKQQSYSQIRVASDWITNNSPGNSTLLIVEEIASVLYYTKMNCVQVTNMSLLQDALKKNNSDYLLVSFYYGPHLQDQRFIDMINYVFANGNIFIPVKLYPPYIDQSKKVPIAAVFRINRDINQSY